jgi:hypothetical protein
MTQSTEYRLETLETVLAEFIMQTNRSLNRMERDTSAFKAEMQQLREEDQRKEELRLAELQAFQVEQQRKEELRLAEVQAYQVEQQRKEELRLAEVQAYQVEQQRKEELRLAEKKQADEDWKKEKKQMNREWNQKWGAMAHKLGTFAEDLAAPNLKRIAREQFGCERVHFFAVRIDRDNPTDPSQTFEFDALLVCGRRVFLLEAKFTARDNHIKEITQLIENFRLSFPEYKDYELITVFASMSIQPSQIKYLTRLGIYAMALGEETMELLNFDELQGR